MKDVGHTTEGNRLVEMTREEHNEFCNLCHAIEGSGFPGALIDRGYILERGFDLKTTFGVIRAYYLNKFRISEFQELLNTMKESLEKEDG